jgi:hypothetical protein
MNLIISQSDLSIHLTAFIKSFERRLLNFGGVFDAHALNLLNVFVEVLDRLHAHDELEQHFVAIRLDIRHDGSILAAFVFRRRHERHFAFSRRLRPDGKRIFLLREREILQLKIIAKYERCAPR